MKIVQINTFSYKATGSIMMNIHQILTENGEDSYVCWGRGKKSNNDHEISLYDNIGIKFHGIYTRIFDKTGFASWRATKKLIGTLECIKPDIIHLHNIHGYYLNIEWLFEYIRKKNIKVIWTLHDCWAITGHCAWFDVCGCQKWKTGCYNCEQLNTYPVSKVVDNSRSNWEKKRLLFTGLDLTIVTPCNWLADIVRKSYLKDYPIKVIYNGIDLNIFKPLKEMKNKIIRKYGFDERKIVLGVASEWTPRKGLADLIKIAEIMPEIQVVIVGLSKKQIKKLPKNIRGIERTGSANELAELYSSASVFFNPTYEDNFPTTNIEALACGTPIVTYDTGGSPEAISEGQKKSCKAIGKVIIKKDSKSVDFNEVKNILEEMLSEACDQNLANECRKAAIYFDKNERLREYLKLYCV